MQPPYLPPFSQSSLAQATTESNSVTMLVILLAAFSAWIVFLAVRPVIQYFWDAKGLRKYPNQNMFSGITNLAYGWEVGRSHRLFHTRRLHEQLVQNPIMRVGANWLSFGSAQAARDIYSFQSPCTKGGIFDALQEGGGESLLMTTNRSFHSARRRMVAVSYAPGNIELWEPRVVDSASVLVAQLDNFRKTSDTGVPAVVAVNVIAPYILACLLNRPKRLIFIASMLHKQAKTDPKDVLWLERNEADFQYFQAYCDTKFHVILIANAVARRFKGTSVTSVHPGWVATKLGGESAIDKMEDGVETYVILAEGDYDEKLTGIYFEPKKQMGELLAATKDETSQEFLVKTCKDITGIKLAV